MRHRALCRNRNGLRASLARQQENAADHFFRFGKRTIDDVRCPAAHLYACTAAVVLQRLAQGEEPASLQRLTEVHLTVVQRAPICLGARRTYTPGFYNHKHRLSLTLL